MQPVELDCSGAGQVACTCVYTLSLIMRIFVIINDILQHYYDERCSSERRSSC